MGVWDEFEAPENDTPDYWNPQSPEKLRGKLVDIDVHVDEEGNRFPQVTIEVNGKEIVVTGFRKILRDELLTLVKDDGAVVGDTVEIDFQGQPKGKRYYVYRAHKVAEAPKRGAKADAEEF